MFSVEKNPPKIHGNLAGISGLKEEKVLPDVTSDYKNLADNFVNYFEEKIERICHSLDKEVPPDLPVTTMRNSRFSKFKELSMND